MTNYVSWWDPKLVSKPVSTIGFGVVATQLLAQGELLAVWGEKVITTKYRNLLPEAIERYTIQVETDLHLACDSDEAGVAEHFNHSCMPNAGLQGQIVLVAMRDIAVGEDVCFDYAMSEADPDFKMVCVCNQPNCHHMIIGNDWQIPELQQRYIGYIFSLHRENDC
jgi:uncharacterized protein